MTTQQLNLNEEQKTALLELIAERVEVKRSAAAALAAAEEAKRKAEEEKQAEADRWAEHLKRWNNGPHGDAYRATQAALDKNRVF